ncbi:MAG: peptidase M14 [Ignavibacteriales bacterium]|nr:peptidase M14 [Ignavibacteriales bacterium]
MSHSFGKNWITHFEQSGFLNSPRYVESIKYFKQFESKTPYAKMFSIGSSPQNRSIECFVVAKNKEFTSARAKKGRKAIVLIQNGIHAGEIEGKDACMLLLRDILITKEKFYLLDHLILLVIPILNVDGHERVSPFNRPNQNGPKEMGWRTNSWNLNLNRDYLKADTPEIRAFLKLFNEWRPDFFIDNHTTDGADYQYHITYALERNGNIDKKLGEWGQKKLLPHIIQQTEARGFLTAPYIVPKDDVIEHGIVDDVALPRLSTGYAAIQNRLGLLVETHSLKPYENRVQSTLSMNLAALEFVSAHWKLLKDLNSKADARATRLRSLPVNFNLTETSEPFKFKAFTSNYHNSKITGNDVIRYTSEPVVITIPFYNSIRNSVTIKIPKAYLVPKEFAHLMDVLNLHGIEFSQLDGMKSYTAEEYSFDEYLHAPKPYEGRSCVKVKCGVKKYKVQPSAGTFIVPVNQRTMRVIINLLEPEAPDSFVSWGFFNAWFERKEYAEPYIMEPYAQQMFENDPLLRNEFLHKLEHDEEFKSDPKGRLDFFYERSPFFDQKEKKYPILRVI